MGRNRILLRIRGLVCIGGPFLLNHLDDFWLALLKLFLEFFRLVFEFGHGTPVLLEAGFQDLNFLLGKAFVELKEDQLLALRRKEVFDEIVGEVAVFRELGC